MADQVDGVQPEEVEGQGAETADSPYQSYLDRIPEEVRGDVEPVFRDWDANTTRRFQDAADYKRGWEPYEQLGVNRLPPEEVQWLLQFRDALQTPTAIQEWYQQYAQERGLTPQQEAAQADEWVDPQVAQVLEKQLSTQLGPIAQQLQELGQWRAAQEQQSREQAALQTIQSEFDSLKEKHGSEFNETAVEKLIANYVESDPEHAVQRAFADWQAIRSQVEKDTLQSKADQPLGAESGGSAASTPERISTLAQAAEIAREQIRASRG